MTTRLRVAVLLLALLGVLAGCGRKGRPIAPMGRGPMPPASVGPRQLGEEILVAVSASPVRRDGKPLRGPVVVEILLMESDRTEGGSPFEGRGREREFLQRAVVAAELPLESGPEARKVARVQGAIPRGRLAGINVEQATLVLAARVRDGRGRRSTPSARSALSPVPPPAAPSGLVVTPLEDGVRLAWEPPAGDAPVAYHVYRRVGDGAWPPRPTLVVDPEAPGALDPDVRYGERYAYAVRASASPGRPYVESVSVEAGLLDYLDVFPPPAPDEVGALEVPSGIRVVWFPGRGSPAARYRVQRATGSGDFRDVAAVESPVTDWIDEDAAPGARHRYRVIAEDELGNASPPSEEAEGTRVAREDRE